MTENIAVILNSSPTMSRGRRNRPVCVSLCGSAAAANNPAAGIAAADTAADRTAAANIAADRPAEAARIAAGCRPAAEAAHRSAAAPPAPAAARWAANRPASGSRAVRTGRPTVGFITAGPAHAKAHVVRGDVLHGRRIVDEVGAVEIDRVARLAVAEIEIAVAQFDRETLGDVIRGAGMQRPGKIGLGVVLGPAAAARDDVVVADNWRWSGWQRRRRRR